MKNVFLTFLMFAGVTAFAQDINPDLKTAVKESPFTVKDSVALPSTNLSYYSTNYFKVFGRDQYTFDKMAFGNQVYVSSDNNFYKYGNQNLPNALPADQVLNYYDYQSSGGTAVMGAAVLGIGTFGAIKNLMDGTKDYSPKIEPKAFKEAGRE